MKNAGLLKALDLGDVDEILWTPADSVLFLCCELPGFPALPFS